jgi:alanyl aminopeptidase
MRLSVITVCAIAVLSSGCGARDATPPGTSAATDQPSDTGTAAADPYRLSADILPLAQQVMLNIDPAQTGYSGSTTISIEVVVESPSIRLHAKDMEISSLHLMANGAPVDVQHESGEHDLLILTRDSGFAAGIYELTIAFENEFNVDGVGISRTEIDGENYIFSQFEAIDARQAFPCFDEPGFKFPWQMTMTVPADVTPITNTPEVSVTEQGGSKTVVFDTTPPISSYLVAVAVGPYEFVPIGGMSIPGRVAVPKGKAHLAAAAVETTPPVLAYLEDYFGQPYPFKKLDLIAVNLSFAGAMEHPGAITYSDFFLLLDDTASASERSLLIKITAHELAHQWFGNLVTMEWWNDLWLNESFADWMGDKAAEAVYPELSGGLSELRTQFFVMNGDEEKSTKPIRHDFRATDNFEDGIFLSYYKGKAVLGMFEEAVSPEIFRDGVIRYLRKFSRDNAQANDLWAEINAGAEFDLAGGMASFIDQPGVPLVTVTELGGGRYEFTQSRIVSGGEDIEQTWIIPLNYRYAVGDLIRTASLVIDDPSEIVDLDEEVDWILPNADQLGYFRWSVPESMLVELGADAATDLNVRERMGLISNLWSLFGADKLAGDEYLLAVQRMSADTDADVLRALINQLPQFREIFITPDLQSEFADFTDELLSPVLQRIGTTTLSDDSSAVAELRPRVLALHALYAGDEASRQVVKATVDRYLSGAAPMSEAVDVALRTLPDWSGTELFAVYRERILEAQSPSVRRSFARGVGAFRDPKVVAEVLDYVLNSEELRSGEVAMVLADLFSADELNPMLLEWAMQHDAELRALLPEGELVQFPGRLMLCSAENVEIISDFYLAPERFVAGIKKEIAEEAAEKRSCAAFRAREIASVREFMSAN